MRSKLDVIVLLICFLSCIYVWFLYGQEYEKKKHDNRVKNLWEMNQKQFQQTDDLIDMTTECINIIITKQMAIDIHKRQIKNLEAVIDGLNTIINKDVKMKRIIKG